MNGHFLPLLFQFWWLHVLGFWLNCWPFLPSNGWQVNVMPFGQDVFGFFEILKGQASFFFMVLNVILVLYVKLYEAFGGVFCPMVQSGFPCHLTA